MEKSETLLFIYTHKYQGQRLSTVDLETAENGIKVNMLNRAWKNIVPDIMLYACVCVRASVCVRPCVCVCERLFISGQAIKYKLQQMCNAQQGNSPHAQLTNNY